MKKSIIFGAALMLASALSFQSCGKEDNPTSKGEAAYAVIDNVSISQAQDGVLTIPAGQKVYIKDSLEINGPLTITSDEKNPATIIVEKGFVATDNFVLENVKIEAANLDGALISLSKNPTVAFLPKADGSGNTDYYGIGKIKLDNVAVDGLKGSIFYDNNIKYCVVDFTINNSIFNLATETVENEALIAFKAGGIKDITISNSTFAGNNAIAKYFVRYNNSARLDRYGYDKSKEFMNITYLNNTFYGLLKSDGQWANYSGVAGQAFIKFDIEKNIWFNSSNEIIRRIGGGRYNAKAPATFNMNTYFLNGKDNSEKESSYDKSGTILTTDPAFVDPAKFNFTPTGEAQVTNKTGDPRWIK